MSNLGKYRMIITEYFDVLTSDIDLLTEKELQANSSDAEKMTTINAKRDVYLNEIKRAEAINMQKLNAFESKDLEKLDQADELTLRKQLFSAVFCFIVEFKKLTRLIVTTSYLTNDQISSYNTLLSYSNIDESEDQNQSLNQLKSLLDIENQDFCIFRLDFTLFMQEFTGQLVFNVNIDDLFRIDSLKLWYVHVKKVYDSAAFLFSNIKELEVKPDTYSTKSLDSVASMLSVFQAVQSGSKRIELVHVDAILSEKHNENDEEAIQPVSDLSETLAPLVDFNLKSLILSTSRKTEKFDNLEAKIFNENWLGISTLHLNGLSIQSIKPDTFLKLEHLRELSLEYNQLDDKCMNVNSFSGLQVLRVLSLRGNELTRVPDALFKNIWRLERLDLSDNHLVGIEAGAFGHLTFLTDLFISRNKIESLDADAFDGLFNLLLLDLEGNPVANSFDRSVLTKHLTSIVHIQLT